MKLQVTFNNVRGLQPSLALDEGLGGLAFAASACTQRPPTSSSNVALSNELECDGAVRELPTRVDQREAVPPRRACGSAGTTKNERVSVNLTNTETLPKPRNGSNISRANRDYGRIRRLLNADATGGCRQYLRRAAVTPYKCRKNRLQAAQPDFVDVRAGRWRSQLFCSEWMGVEYRPQTLVFCLRWETMPKQRARHGL